MSYFSTVLREFEEAVLDGRAWVAWKGSFAQHMSIWARASAGKELVVVGASAISASSVISALELGTGTGSGTTSANVANMNAGGGAFGGNVYWDDTVTTITERWSLGTTGLHQAIQNLLGISFGVLATNIGLLGSDNVSYASVPGFTPMVTDDTTFIALSSSLVSAVNHSVALLFYERS